MSQPNRQHKLLPQPELDATSLWWLLLKTPPWSHRRTDEKVPLDPGWPPRVEEAGKPRPYAPKHVSSYMTCDDTISIVWNICNRLSISVIILKLCKYRFYHRPYILCRCITMLLINGILKWTENAYNVTSRIRLKLPSGWPNIKQPNDASKHYI